MDQSKSKKEDPPNLDDWMSQIRQKKLRPVVPNQHKSQDRVQGKNENTAGLHTTDDLLKMRQGLRSVSTPKWPGANDSKNKTNAAPILTRAQLRSVSDTSKKTDASKGSDKDHAASTSDTQPTKDETASAAISSTGEVAASADATPQSAQLSEVETTEVGLPISSTVAGDLPMIESIAGDGSTDTHSKPEESQDKSESIADATQNATSERVLEKIGSPTAYTAIRMSSSADEEQSTGHAVPPTADDDSDFPLDTEPREAVDEPQSWGKADGLTASSGVASNEAHVTALADPPKPKTGSSEVQQEADDEDSGESDFPLDIEQQDDANKPPAEELDESLTASSGVALNDASMTTLRDPPKSKTNFSASADVNSMDEDEEKSKRAMRE